MSGVRYSTGAATDYDPGSFVLDDDIAARLRLNADGLVPVVVQDATDKRVLMMAWMDAPALACTLETRKATYYSRSRGEYWIKGLTSGSVQAVEAVALDCDGDTVLLTVTQTGGACHTGDDTCFDSGRIL